MRAEGPKLLLQLAALKKKAAEEACCCSVRRMARYLWSDHEIGKTACAATYCFQRSIDVLEWEDFVCEYAQIYQAGSG